MTQMLLFDAPVFDTPVFDTSATAVSASGSAVAEVASAVPATHTTGPSRTDYVYQANQTGRANQSERPGYREGLNHMGDLARLVLLRHDLVAARRGKRNRK